MNFHLPPSLLRQERSSSYVAVMVLVIVLAMISAYALLVHINGLEHAPLRDEMLAERNALQPADMAR